MCDFWPFFGLFPSKNGYFSPFFAVFIVYHLSSRPAPIFGQVQQFGYRLERWNETLTDDVLKRPGEVEEWSEIMDDLQIKKIDLNKAERQDLNKLTFLTHEEISLLLSYRERFGPFIHKIELQAVPGLSNETIRSILPYVYVVHGFSHLSVASRKDIRHLFRIQWAPDMSASDNDYLGSRDGIRLKWLFYPSHGMQMGILAEKDPGEPWGFQNHLKPFDHIGYFAEWKPRSRFLKRVIAGHYRVHFGQGLIQNAAFRLGKSGQIKDMAKSGPLLRLHQSYGEHNYYHGIAAQWQWSRQLRAISFISRRLLDVRMNDSSASNTFSSILTSGLHRTSDELSRKDTATGLVGGARIYYEDQSGSVGLQAIRHHFTPGWMPRDTINRFRGNLLFNTSFDCSLTWQRTFFFGEYAKSFPGGTAWVIGLMKSLHPSVGIGLLMRRYAPNYHSYASGGFGEVSSTNNENGLFLTLTLSPAEHFMISGYVDIFNHPWKRNEVLVPSAGKEAMLRLSYTNKKKVLAYMQYRYELKLQNITTSSAFGQLSTLVRHRLRVHMEKHFTSGWSLRSRFERSRLVNRPQTEILRGWLWYLDLLYTPLGSRLNLKMRACLFDVQNYSVRIYAFENDLTGRFAIPSFEGEGFRSYLQVKWSTSRNSSLECRLGYTAKRDHSNLWDYRMQWTIRI